MSTWTGWVDRDDFQAALPVPTPAYDQDQMPSPHPDVLARLPLFQRVHPDDRARVAAAGRLQQYARGDDLFQEGEEPHAFVTVIEGRVKIYKSRCSRPRRMDFCSSTAPCSRRWRGAEKRRGE
jgi:hypothetical protein